ncbi:MAG: phospholipid carrier-dependent glycosyltransferase [Usitatibacter sp.]
MQGSLNRILLWVLVAVTILVAAGTLGRSLANPDEGRYSEISREMAASGDWVTPRLNGIKYFEKPPLQYWATAAALELFGGNEYSARLYVALCALACVLLVGYTARRLWGAQAGLAPMLVLVSSPYFMALGTIVTLDMGLTLWTTATLCAYMLAQRPAIDARERRRWLLAAWAAIALAVLSKGLIGIVFPAAALGLSCLLRRNLRPLLHLEWARGGAVFLAICAPWFILVSLANPEFPHFFFVHEHFERFLTSAHHRTQPAWFFVPILLLGLLPWIFALPAAVAKAWRDEAQVAELRPLRFALLFSAFVLIFFSASGSKLPAYILPMFPPLALVLGRYLVDVPPRRLAKMLAPTMALAFALGAAAWLSPEFTGEAWNKALYRDARPWMVAGSAMLGAAGFAGSALLWAGWRREALLAVSIGVALAVGSLGITYERFFSPRQSGKIVAQKMTPHLGPATRLYAVRHYDQTVPFYIGRTMTLVEYVDEFETGLQSEPGRNLPSVDLFAPDWLRPGDALAIMQPGTFETLRKDGLPMRVLHEDPRRVLVRKP